MENVQLPGSKRFDTQMVVHTAKNNNDMSLALEFQKHLSNKSHKHGIIDNKKQRNVRFKKVDKQRL